MYGLISKPKGIKLKKLKELEARELKLKNWKIPDWVEEDAVKRKQKGKSAGRKNQKAKGPTAPATVLTTGGIITAATSIPVDTDTHNEINDSRCISATKRHAKIDTRRYTEIHADTRMSKMGSIEKAWV